jgi:hypothetical protein
MVSKGLNEPNKHFLYNTYFSVKSSVWSGTDQERKKRGFSRQGDYFVAPGNNTFAVSVILSKSQQEDKTPQELKLLKTRSETTVLNVIL